MNNKIAVLGPIPYDHITTSKGMEIIKYGCATHPVIALAKLMAGTGQVAPVTHIRKKDTEAVRTLLGAYDNILLDAVFDGADQGDVIQLRFVDQNNRLEKQTAFMPPISPKDMMPVMDSDIFVGVPISDYEVPLETLRFIRENRKANAITIFDAHGPTTTVTTTGERLRRFWIERDLWIPYIDILKMNIEEAGCCWFKKEYEADELNETYQELSEADMSDFARYVLGLGLKALYITLDARGCMVYSLDPAGEMKADFVKSVWVEEVIDTTGCGDSFAGGLAFGLLEDRENYIRAAQFANALGALRTQGTTFDVFRSKAETEAIIQLSYGVGAVV